MSLTGSTAAVLSIDPPSCPRRLLEERKVLYLSREEPKLCEVRRPARDASLAATPQVLPAATP